jgi:hypothetical protein
MILTEAGQGSYLALFYSYDHVLDRDVSLMSTRGSRRYRNPLCTVREPGYCLKVDQHRSYDALLSCRFATACTHGTGITGAILEHWSVISYATWAITNNGFLQISTTSQAVLTRTEIVRTLIGSSVW